MAVIGAGAATGKDAESRHCRRHTEIITADARATAQKLVSARTKFVSSGLVTESDGQLGFRNALLVRDPDGHPILIEEK